MAKLENDEVVGEPEEEKATVSLKPWEGKATRADKVLITAPFVIMAILLAFRPFHPFLLANNPVLLALISGSTSSIGAAAAFAKVEDTTLWWPFLAGVFGSIKFSWLFWLAGKRWGKKIIDLASPSEGLKSQLWKAQDKKWIGRIGVVLVELPGIPSLILQLFAGWQKMRFVTFMLLSALGASIWTGFIVYIGYSLGQDAVDVVLLVDKYAIWISIAMIVGLSFYGSHKAKQAQVAKGKSKSITDEKDEN